MSMAFKTALDTLETVLSRENDALLSAEFSALGPLKLEKLDAVTSVDRFQAKLELGEAVSSEIETQLSRIRGLVIRNAGLLQAALYGARSAQDRLTGLSRQDQQIGAYDKSGRPMSFESSGVNRKFKV